jgi:hypothetical protein
MPRRKQVAEAILETVIARNSRRGRKRRVAPRLTPEQREQRRQEAMDVLWEALPIAAAVLRKEVESGNASAAQRVMDIVLGSQTEQAQQAELLAAMTMLAKALESDAAIRRARQAGTGDAGAGVQESAV